MDGNESIHTASRVYEDEVKLFNAITVDSAANGYVYRDRSHVSIEQYGEIYEKWCHTR